MSDLGPYFDPLPAGRLEVMPRDYEAWFPATAFGDTGAASTAIGIAMAVRAFARGYALGGDIAVLAQSDNGASGCCVVCAPSHG